MKFPFATLAVALFAAAAAAQSLVPADELTAIQDNSFLVEEAYNQETGVVQYISVFTRDRRTDDWVYSFTNEIPVRSQAHQFSYTLSMLGDGSRRLGDVMLNYRYQLRGTGESLLAISPRLSVVIPTDDDSSSGLELNLPVSRVYGSHIVGHTNAGAAWYSDVSGVELRFGHSFIYALSPNVHLMAEAAWARSDEESELFLNPGVRFAINRPGGLQIVPGIAFPIGAGPSAGERQVLLYVSFER